MSKTYLVELTEYEIEHLQDGLSGLKPSILSKLNEALIPQENILITHKDYKNLLSLAKDEWVKLPKELRISNKETDDKDLVRFSLANALIMWLNNKNVLKRLVRFDFTDHSNEYDSTGD